MASDRSRLKCLECFFSANGEVLNGENGISDEIRSRVEISFGLSKETEVEKCPGESKCSMFALALSEAGNGLEACGGCHLLPTKPGNKEADTASPTDNFINKLYYIRQRRDSGFGLDENKITYLESEGLLILDHEIERAKQGLQVLTYQMQKAFLESMRAMNG